MEKERLLQTLNELRAEVTRADDVDPETLASLEAAIRDLQRELDKRGVKAPADIAPATTGLKDVLLRFEAEQLSFHQGLREAYRKIAADDPARCVLIDANSDPDTVAGRIWTALRDRLLPTPASVVSI